MSNEEVNVKQIAIPYYKDFWKNFFPICSGDLYVNKETPIYGIGSHNSLLHKEHGSNYTLIFNSDVLLSVISYMKKVHSLFEKIDLDPNGDIIEINSYSNYSIDFCYISPNFHLFLDQKNRMIKHLNNNSLSKVVSIDQIENLSINSIKNKIILNNRDYTIFTLDDNLTSFQSLNKIDSVNLGQIRISGLIFLLHLLKKFEKYMLSKKITKLYLIRLIFHENSLEITGEYRNENYSSWSLFLAKNN